MRKLFTFITLFIASTLISASFSNAAQTTLITEPTHRLSDGIFYNDLLATKLEPTGDLGKLIYSNTSAVKTWFVDPATIEEIVAMSSGYTVLDIQTTVGQKVAQDWLAQFIKITRNKEVIPITYGNPSNYWIDEIVGDQIEYLNQVGKIKLESLLSRPTGSVSPLTVRKKGLSKISLATLKYGQRQINLLSTIVEKNRIESTQLRLSQLLNPDIEKDTLIKLIEDYDKSLTLIRSKVKIEESKFTLSNSKEQLPITITNDFDQEVNLNLSSRAMNSKVRVQSLGVIKLAPKSKTQALLPVEVLAAGESKILVQLTNLKNNPVGYPAYIDLKLSLISPVTTWITTSAAVLLIAAALYQSVRRVRKHR